MSEQILQLTGTVELQAADAGDEQPAKIHILAYNGGVMKMPPGPTVVDLDSMEVPESFPILADHRQDIEHTLGSGSGRVLNGKFYVDGVLARNTYTQDVIKLAKAGVQLQASISVAVSSLDFAPIDPGGSVHVNGRTINADVNGSIHVARNSFLREVTVCPLGADNKTVVTIAAAAQQLEDAELSIETETTDVELMAMDRIERIDDLCQDAGNPRILVGEQMVSLKAHAISSGWDTDRVELECRRQKDADTELERLRNSYESGSFTPRGPASADAPDEHLLQAAFMARAGYDELAVRTFGERTVEAARHQFPTTMHAARHIAERNGYGGGSQTEILRASFAASNLSLPVALGDTLHRVVEALYREAPQTWGSFAAVRSAKDFRTNRSFRPSFSGELVKVGDGGAIEHGVLTEEDAISWEVDQYARMFSVGRKTLINDDLSVLEEMPPILASAAMRAVSDLVWQTLLSATYANTMSGGSSPLSLASLQTAVTTMRTQRNTEGHDLDIMPKVLVVPPELETTARQILESVEVTPSVADGGLSVSQPTGNALKSIASLQVEPRISNPRFTGNSATRWFLFAGPMDIPAIVGFLDDQKTPKVEFFGLDHDASHLGVSWRCYHDFGAVLGDTKASVSSAGA